MNDLVRNNSQALECQSLSASSREALNDPALVLFLKTSNLLWDKINDDVVIDVLEAFEALLDTSGVGSTGLHMITQNFSRADAFPFEVLRKGLKVFLAVASRSSN